ncbi:cysteine hydrolase family protein [Reichenbachiella versicolor]|uniref:cysteine hydrolase family protein n=1 Tax=Reichenbachiella versicolor TaxID=1821036 RepID=UPI000D6DC639|nr:cysteine hydrolase family protein [Reichenbachiella versicolor]
MTKKALIVIDMQKGSFTPQTPRYDTDGVVYRINQLAEQFRKLNSPVIYVQHDGTGSGEFEKGTTEWENLDELEVRSSDIIIDKYANDVFYQSDIQGKLSDLGIEELVITGCATDFCVESSIQSALTKDYSITVVEDGHTTGDRPGLSAKQVIDHYNWVWKNMIPTKGTIVVKNTAQILENIQ